MMISLFSTKQTDERRFDMKKLSYTFLVFTILTFLFLLSPPVVPAEEAGPVYFGFFAGYVIPEDLKLQGGGTDMKIDLKNNAGYGLKLGYIFPALKWLATEMEYAHIQSQDVNEPGSSGEFKADNLMANLVVRYPKGNIHPYIGGGVGWSWGDFKATGPVIDSINDKDNAFAWQVLAGVNFEITPKLSADVGYRYVRSKYNNVCDDLDAKSANHMFLIGLNFHFGGPKPVVAETPPPQVEPVQEVVKEEPVVVKDSDGDGVLDDLDKCPDTPQGCVVDKDGCPIDSDKDGVCDGLDKCPGTPAGVKVDEKGCPIKVETPVAKELIEKGRARINVEFDFNKAVVKPKYNEEIKKFADVMKDHPELNVVIEGNTDSVGKDAYNQKLSEKRAESVKNYMIEKFGIDKSRLSSKGYGESKPIADNKTKEGRQKNRRVEAVVDYLIKK
jgi:outer membrane protein OmpA-like peptidoglycan-associated protein/opacity protein-like surface antigen